MLSMFCAPNQRDNKDAMIAMMVMMKTMMTMILRMVQKASPCNIFAYRFTYLFVRACMVPLHILSSTNMFCCFVILFGANQPESLPQEPC